MRKSIVGLLMAGCAAFAQPSHAQLVKCLTYTVEANASASGGNYSPLWLNANRYGLSSVEKQNGYFRAGLFSPYEEGKKFAYRFGLDLAGAYHAPSAFVIQQAYLDLRYWNIELSFGSKERPMEIKNQELSSGGMTNSNNARPIPQVRITLPDYIPVDRTGFFSFKGYLAYGLFSDWRWQRDFIQNPGQKHTEHTLYHSKALFAKIGNEERFPLVFEGGLEMGAQFGGKTYDSRFDPYLNNPNGLKDFFKILIPSGSDATDGQYANVEGNHLGSWQFALSYKFPQAKVKAYYEHYFEDHSMLFGEYGWKDGLIGVELTLPKNPVVSSFVYEYVGTKDQAGPIYHDHTPQIADQISARDNYYNHGLFTGWQHWGQAIGNPLLTSPIYNTDGQIAFKNNRIKAHHFGLNGQPTQELHYRLLLSCTQNWGTYGQPFTEVQKNTSFLAEVGYAPQQLPGWSFQLAFAFDRGELLGDNTGGMLTIRKSGILFHK